MIVVSPQGTGTLPGTGFAGLGLVWKGGAGRESTETGKCDADAASPSQCCGLYLCPVTALHAATITSKSVVIPAGKRRKLTVFSQ